MLILRGRVGARYALIRMGNLHLGIRAILHVVAPWLAVGTRETAIVGVGLAVGDLVGREGAGVVGLLVDGRRGSGEGLAGVAVVCGI